MNTILRRLAPVLATTAALALLASCGSDNSAAPPAAGSTTTAASTGTTASGGASTTTGPTTTTDPGISNTSISAERCAANKAAGKITYISSFDFSASASILDVVVAKDRGYFDDLCLDVDIKPGFSTSNYPLVAANQAQFSSAGSYTEMLNYSKNGAKFVAVADYGKTPIEALVIPANKPIATLQDLRGKTIGEKGDIPPSLVAMLAQAGLKRGVDYKEVLLDGFDPVAQLKTGIDALPVYKSNEPGQLDRAGVKYQLFDPASYDIPGSFGLIYTTPDFLAKHPTAAQDFVRAAFKGFQDAVADPTSAVAISIKEIDAAGNQNFLTTEGETYRWQQESAIVQRGTPTGEAPGLVDGSILENEVAFYAKDNIFPNGTPSTAGTYDEQLARGLFGPDGTLIWPATTAGS